MSKANLSTSAAVAELQKLIQEFKLLQQETREATQEFVKLSSALKSMGAITTNAKAQFGSLDKQLKNITKSQRNYKTQTRNLKLEIQNLTLANKKLENQLRKNDIQNKKSKGGFKGLFNSVKSLAGAFGLIIGIEIFASIIKSAFSLMKTFDGIRFAMQKITKDSNLAASSQRFLTEITDDFGVSLVTTTNRYVKFLAAARQSGLTVRETENIFRSMTKAASVLALQTDELRGVYLALEQMLSKGKVTTEELRRQLGERLPGAMGIMAASMGVTISQLDKMMKLGQVLSADVLPKFAKAVEIAYGIEKEERINTLVSAQNRLTNSWQNFVKYVYSNSKGLISVFNGIASAMNSITEFFSSEARVDNKIIEKKKALEEEIRATAKKALDDRLSDELKYDNVKQQIQDTRAKLTVAKIKKNNDAEVKALEEVIREKTSLLLGYEDEIFLIQQDYAFKNIETNRKQLDEISGKYEAYQESLKGAEGFGGSLVDLAKKGIGGGIIFWVEKLSEKFGESTGEIQALIEKYTELKAKDDTFSRLVEQPDNVSPVDTGVSSKKLKDLKDLTNQINNEILRKTIETNKAILDDEEASLDLKLGLQEYNLVAEAQIIKNDTADKLKEIDKIVEAEYKASQDGITFAEFKANKIKLINDKSTTALLKLELKFNEDKEALVKEHTDFLQEELESKRIKNETNYYNALAVLRSKFEGEELKGKEVELKLAFDEIGLFDTMDVLEQLIVIFEKLGIPVDDLKLALAKAKAELEGLGDTTDIEAQKKAFQETLAIAGQFADALGDIGNAIFDNKIENIEAEMDAITKSYDKQIELAEGHAEKQKHLEEEKQIKLEALEKKRLKEEQKKAKFNKAKAIVDIAINTAVAISRAVAESTFLGLPLIPVLAALGALQIAAVLAQPIPKYKDGLDEAKLDHIAMINDGGQQEYVERGGKILTTQTKNAIVGLKKGDTVHKNYDSMIKETMILNSMTNGMSVSENDYSKLLNTVSLGLKDGFKHAKINNKTNIINKIKDNRYAESMSRWN